VARLAASSAPELGAKFGTAGIVDFGLIGSTKRTFHDYMLSYDYKKYQGITFPNLGKTVLSIAAREQPHYNTA